MSFREFLNEGKPKPGAQYMVKAKGHEWEGRIVTVNKSSAKAKSGKVSVSVSNSLMSDYVDFDDLAMDISGAKMTKEEAQEFIGSKNLSMQKIDGQDHWVDDESGQTVLAHKGK